jgi:hypothetical protein
VVALFVLGSEVIERVGTKDIATPAHGYDVESGKLVKKVSNG